MRDIIDRLRNDEPKFRLNSDAAHEIERLRADLADCRMLLGKYGDTAQELRVACDEKQRCIDSSVAAQREFLAVIDRLRAELTEARRDAGRYRRLCSLVAWGTLGVCCVAEAGDDYADDGVMLDAWLDDPEMIAEVQGIDAAMAGGAK